MYKKINSLLHDIIISRTKTIKALVTILVSLWLFLLSLFYSFNYLNSYSLPICLLLVLIVFYIVFKIWPQLKNKILEFLKFKRQKNIKFNHLFLFLPIFIILFANYSFFISAESLQLNFSKFLKAESNLVYQIFSIYFFYSALILVVYATGKKILKIIKINFDSKLELFLFSIGIGFVPLMLGIFIAAILGLLYPQVVLALLLLLFVFIFDELKKIISEIK
jgi:hypothetical protein